MEWQEQIDEIMDVFNFDNVQKTMQFLDWRWSDDDGQCEVPDKIDLKKQARSLLKMVINDDNEESMHGTGGFQAVKSNGLLSLAFVLEEWQFEPATPTPETRSGADGEGV